MKIPVPWWLYLAAVPVFMAACELVRWWQLRERRTPTPQQDLPRYVRKPRRSEIRRG